MATAILKATHDVGLDTHEWEEASDTFDLLGLSFEHGVLSPKVARMWKLWQALRYVLKSGFLSSRQLSVLVGHFTSLAMVRRELLCVLRAVYPFIQRKFPRPVRIWRTVRREIKWMLASLPLMSCNLYLEWSPEVVAVDASEWSGGACKAQIDPQLVAMAGRFSERWRFNIGEGLSLRMQSRKQIV